MYALIIIRNELNDYQVAEIDREYGRTKERANKWESENDRLKTQLDAQKEALTEAEKEVEGYKVREERDGGGNYDYIILMERIISFISFIGSKR